jgi:hypothetical protein
MHALLHGIDPATSAARATALDTETVKRMVVASMTRPLVNRLQSARWEISAVLGRGSKPLKTALGAQLRTALADPAVQTLFAMNLPPAAAPLAPKVASSVAAAARAPRNTTGLAAGVVAGELAPRALGALIGSRYVAALDALHGAVDIGGIGMNITVEGTAGITSDGRAVIPPSGVWAATSAGGMRTTAGRVVGRVVGAGQRQGKPPPVRPAASLIGQLDALPKAWTTFATSAPAALSSATLQTDLTTALAAAWLARLGTPARRTVSRAKVLAAAADRAVHQAALAASTNAVRAYLASQVEPVLQASVTALSGAITTEVTTLMSTPAGTAATAAPKDPDLARLATRLKTRLTAEVAAAKAAQAASPGSTPVDPGAAAPGQSVTYGTVNMMSDNTNVFRADQFADLAKQVNDPANRLRKDREDPFKVEKA